MKPTQQLHDLGQSIWLDNITRGLLTSGTLRHYIDDLSVTGLTSNPSIFDHAIKNSNFYDDTIRRKKKEGKSGEALFFELAMEDLSQAADLFRPIYEATAGADGWVSLEVSPLLAYDAASTIKAAVHLRQDAGVWADMAAIVWGAGLRVTAAWYIATETTSELKRGGYVQGTVLLVLRKRLLEESAYRDELVQEVRTEVVKQIETMTGLNQVGKESGRSENLFEDQDLQMAGYAAALRVLTGYSRIDGQDMAAAALRPTQTDGGDVVKEIIDFAVQVANEHLVPEGVAPRLWERLTGPERFYLRMLDIETAGGKKLDNYQNFAKAFRYGDYAAAMGSMKANDARLKTALEFKRSEFDGDFGKSALRAVLFALYELQRDVDIDEAISHLRDLVPGYLSRREDLMALDSVIAAKRETKAPAEAQAARILFSRIKNERLG